MANNGLFSMLEVRRLRVGAEYAAQGIADLAQCSVSADGVEQEGHGVCGSSSGALQRIQALCHSIIIAPAAESSQLGALMPGAGLIDLQQLDGLLVALEAID